MKWENIKYTLGHIASAGFIIVSESNFAEISLPKVPKDIDSYRLVIPVVRRITI